MNPSRGKTLDYRPARTTVAVLTYAPHQAGYFEHRMAITRLTIESILLNTHEPFDLLVFDNGSCEEMVAFLQSLYQQGAIDYLFLSKRNIGKLNALRFIFDAAPGEIVAFTDDDNLHLPGWLNAHLEIIDHFPNVGAVTGFYVRQRVAMSSESTLAFTDRPDVETRRGLLMPREWEEEYVINTGRTWERYQKEVAGIEDVIVKYDGIEAWVSAHHFQMVCPKKVVQKILHEMLPDGWSDQLMGRMVEMDDRMDEKGYLRLCTREKFIRIMGNVISPEVEAIAQGMGFDAQAVKLKSQQSGLLGRLMQLKLFRYPVQRVVNTLYKWLNL
jgi:glycosyltransferase involved in cell wall biosynthesis